MKHKTARVEVYINDTLVGSGELAYSDISENALAPYSVFHCDETQMIIDSDAVTLSLCWEDTVAHILPWSFKRKLTVPVYLDSEQTGTAVIEITDEASGSLLGLVIIALIILIVSLALKKRAKEK